MTLLRLTFAAIAIGAIADPSPAWSQWASSPNFNTVVATSPGNEEFSQIVTDGQGGAILAWGAEEAGNYSIRMQRLDRDGNPLWGGPEGLTICSLAGVRVPVAMSDDGAGGAVVAWADDRNEPGVGYDAYIQRIDAAGVTMWTPNGFNLAPFTGTQVPRGIVHDGAGGFLVVWEDERSGTSNSDLYAQRFAASGAIQWAPNGVVVCNAANDQRWAVATSDAAGGFYVAWEDERSGSGSDIYVQRVDGAGTSLMMPNGNPIAAVTGDQIEIVMDSDGAGGAYLAWRDHRFGSSSRLFMEHVPVAGQGVWGPGGIQVGPADEDAAPTSLVADGAGGCIVAWTDARNGSIDPFMQRLNASGVELWTPDGVNVCNAPDAQLEGRLMADGNGGAMILWADKRAAPLDPGNIFGQHVSAIGSMLWPPNGIVVSSAVELQYRIGVTSDGRGGVIACWTDQRPFTQTDLYAQRIEPFGYLGAPEPRIQSVLDVTGDQGGAVRVAWSRSDPDVVPGGPADEYRIWREVSASTAASAVKLGARMIEPGASLPVDARDVFRTSTLGVTTWFWELEAVQPAAGLPGYSRVASTGGVSIPPALHYTRYMVEARDVSTGYHWDSYPDSGYSTDDLAPPTPAPFSGVYAGGNASLSWGPSGAADLSGYRLYRGGDFGFVPGPGNLIATVTGTSHIDTGIGLAWYKVTAIDVHGNESAPAVTLPAGTVDVDDALPATVWLGPATPNPTAGSARFRFALPAEADVELILFDQQGRRVRTLADRAFAAGRHEIGWDGLGERAATLESGVYLYRLRAAGLERTGSFVLIR